MQKNNPEVYKVGESLQWNLLKCKNEDRLDILSAHTSIPIEVLETIVQKGEVHEQWLEWKMIREWLTPQERIRYLQSRKQRGLSNDGL